MASSDSALTIELHGGRSIFPSSSPKPSGTLPKKVVQEEQSKPFVFALSETSQVARGPTHPSPPSGEAERCRERNGKEAEQKGEIGRSTSVRCYGALSRSQRAIATERIAIKVALAFNGFTKWPAQKPGALGER